MRLSISNIAWDVEYDNTIAELLQRYGIDAIDVAPGKYFPDPVQTNDVEIMEVKNWWAEKGIEIIGMQALLFGTTGLNVFASQDIQQAMLNRLEAVCRVSAGLGATRLVFGSPKNRDLTGLSNYEALSVATSFFRQLGDIAESYGVIICLEPNPTCYGANFMTTSEETANVVRSIAHPTIKMQLDTGALAINNEDVDVVLKEHADIIGHIHASERNLIPLCDGTLDHESFARSFRQYLPEHPVTIEMLTNNSESTIQAIEHSLKRACLAYTSMRGY